MLDCASIAHRVGSLLVMVYREEDQVLMNNILGRALRGSGECVRTITRSSLLPSLMIDF